MPDRLIPRVPDDARGNHDHLLFQLGIGASDDVAVWLTYGGRATLDASGSDVALEATRRLVVATDGAPDRRPG